MVNSLVFIPRQKAGNLSLGEMLSWSNGLGATLCLHFRESETLCVSESVQPEHAVLKGKAVIILCAHELENAVKVENALPGRWQGLVGKRHIFT